MPGYFRSNARLLKADVFRRALAHIQGHASLWILGSAAIRAREQELTRRARVCAESRAR